MFDAAFSKYEHGGQNRAAQKSATDIAAGIVAFGFLGLNEKKAGTTDGHGEKDNPKHLSSRFHGLIFAASQTSRSSLMQACLAGQRRENGCLGVDESPCGRGEYGRVRLFGVGR